MRLAVALVLAVVTSLLGGWAIAKYQLADRVTQVAVDARTLCRPRRGNTKTTAESLAKRLADIATEHQLEASDIRIQFRPMGDKPKGAAAQLAGSLSKLTRGKLQMQATEVIATARLQGSKWLWSVDDELETDCIVKGSVTRESP